MSADMMTYLPLILLGLVALVLAAWAVSRLGRKARVIEDDSGTPLARDVLAEGAAPAPRNQALIDAPRAVEIIQGETSAAANSQAVAAAPLGTDAEAGPQVAPEPAPATPVPARASDAPDDLTRIKGLGPKLAALLGEFGITTFAQIAAWDQAEIERIDAKLGRFSGRINHDQWVEQAKLLATGDESSFVSKFGQNG